MRLLTVTLLLLPAVSTATVPQWAGSPPEPIVRAVTTNIRYVNGDEQRNTGSGFVIGGRFYTAYHNLRAGSSKVESREILIGGMLLEPAAVDVIHDLAVFDLPPALCATWCNDLQLVARPAESTESVVWLGLEGERRVWKQGHVNNLAFKSETTGREPAGCDDNLIVEIDHPFVPGSSGGPVFDAATGRIAGLIQGSLETPSGQVTGYYKPVECLISRLKVSSLTPAAARGGE